MLSLHQSKWMQLNDFVVQLNSDFSYENFLKCCLEELPKVLGVSFLVWGILDQDLTFHKVRASRDFQDRFNGLLPMLEETLSSHPIITALSLQDTYNSMSQPFTISDFVSEREYFETAIYREVYREMNVRDQLWVELKLSENLRCGFSVNSDKPIQDEQRIMMELLYPHLISVYRHVLKYAPIEPGPIKSEPGCVFEKELSPRLGETLEYLLQGDSRKMISSQMNLSIHTVNDYIKEIYATFNLHSRAEVMAMFAIKSRYPPRK